MEVRGEGVRVGHGGERVGCRVSSVSQQAYPGLNNKRACSVPASLGVRWVADGRGPSSGGGGLVHPSSVST